MSQYQPRSYWARLHERADLSAVGQSGLPAGTNRWLYATLERRLGQFVDRHQLAPAEVYEVGAGTGYWLDWWARREAMVSGCDLIPAAVERLCARFGDRFEVLDITERTPGRTANLVLVMNVLLHVTDEQDFRRALAHVAAAVAPGGYLLMVEPIQSHGRYHRAFRAGASSKARPEKDYVAPLAAAGLDLIALEPATALGSDPIEARSRSLLTVETFVCRTLKAPARVGLGELSGRLVYGLDPVAIRLGARYASRFLLMRRSH